MDFFQTGMGKKFYDRDVPELIKAINRLADAMEKQNKAPQAHVKNLTAVVTGDENYPGIRIEALDENGDSNIVAVVEYSEGKLQTVAYNETDDEPEAIVKWEKG